MKKALLVLLILFAAPLAAKDKKPQETLGSLHIKSMQSAGRMDGGLSGKLNNPACGGLRGCYLYKADFGDKSYEFAMPDLVWFPRLTVGQDYQVVKIAGDHFDVLVPSKHGNNKFALYIVEEAEKEGK
jgi:hypothetical protein